MSYESLWYSMYSPQGEPPHCTRWSRLPMSTQWDLAIDLAISLCDGIAGYRKTFVMRTRELYWYFPHPLSKTGWWLIPARTDKRAMKLREAAISQACHRQRGPASQKDAAHVLREWKRTGSWRRHVWGIVPRHPKSRQGGRLPQ